MKFELLAHEIAYLEQLDCLIKESSDNVFIEKILNLKLAFFKELLIAETEFYKARAERLERPSRPTRLTNRTSDWL